MHTEKGEKSNVMRVLIDESADRLARRFLVTSKSALTVYCVLNMFPAPSLIQHAHNKYIYIVTPVPLCRCA